MKADAMNESHGESRAPSVVLQNSELKVRWSSMAGAEIILNLQELETNCHGILFLGSRGVPAMLRHEPGTRGPSLSTHRPPNSFLTSWEVKYNVVYHWHAQ